MPPPGSACEYAVERAPVECTGIVFDSCAYSSRRDRASPPPFSASFLFVHRFLLRRKKVQTHTPRTRDNCRRWRRLVLGNGSRGVLEVVAHEEQLRLLLVLHSALPELAQEFAVEAPLFA